MEFGFCVLVLAFSISACGDATNDDQGSGSPSRAGGEPGTEGGGMADNGGGAGSAGSAGLPDTGGAGGVSGSGGSVPPPTPNAPVIPTASEPCPTLETGTVTVLGQDVRLWVGERRDDVRGPVFFYWHGTGSTAEEASFGLGPAISEIQGMGGVVASFTTTTEADRNTGNGVWYTGDFEMADTILACAVEQLNIDTRRVFTGGCSAGGLQASAMVYARSSYLAGAMPNSGGIFSSYSLEDPSHVPSVITTHGAPGVDVVGIDFSVTSERFVDDIVSEGGFAVNCNHGGGHCALPSDVRDAQFDFLMAHPFDTDPSPYANELPSGFPSVCEIQ